MDTFDKIWGRIYQKFVTPLLQITFIIDPGFIRYIQILYLRSHRTIDDQNAFIQN
jgi:hypothetical protein